jgi:hypothetical protein
MTRGTPGSVVIDVAELEALTWAGAAAVRHGPAVLDAETAQHWASTLRKSCRGAVGSAACCSLTRSRSDRIVAARFRTSCVLPASSCFPKREYLSAARLKAMRTGARLSPFVRLKVHLDPLLVRARWAGLRVGVTQTFVSASRKSAVAPMAPTRAGLTRRVGRDDRAETALATKAATIRTTAVTK